MIKDYKNFFIYGFGQLINLISPIIVAPKIISVCGINNWGKVGVATSVFIITNNLIDCGSNLIGVKDVSTNRNDDLKITKILNETYALRFYILLVLFCMLIIVLFVIPHNLIILYLLGFFLLIAQTFNTTWFYQGKEDFNKINVMVFLSKSLYLILVYVFIRKKEDYIYTLFFLGLANFIVYGYTYLSIKKKYNLSISKVKKENIIAKFIKERPIILGNLFTTGYLNGGIIIVNFFLGDYLSGIYKIADMILSIFRSYLSVFFNVSFPRFCSKFKIDNNEGKKFLKNINTLNIALLSTGLIIMFLLINWLVDHNYFKTNMLTIIQFSKKIIWIPIIVAINIPFYQYLIYEEKQNSFYKIFVSGFFLMIISNFILIQKFALLGSLYSIYIIEIYITFSLILLAIINKNTKQNETRLS